MQQLWTATKALLLLVVLASPAFGLENFPPAGVGGPTDLRSYTRFVHLAPDIGSVAISLGAFKVTTLAYGQRTCYQAINQGNYTVDIQPAGGCTLDPITSFGPLHLYSQYYSTVLVVGRCPALRLMYLPDDPSLPPACKVRVRFVNAALDAPPMTLATTTCVPVYGNLPGGYSHPDRCLSHFDTALPLIYNLPAGCISPYQLLSTYSNGFQITAGNSACPLVHIPSLPRCARVVTIVFFSGETPEAPYHAVVLVDR